MVRTIGRALALVFAFAGTSATLAQDSPSAVALALAGKTIRFWSDRLGPDFEYFAPDGRTLLWRPGHWDVADGTWSDGTFRIKSTSTPGAQPKTQVVPMVCFAFPATSYGAVARATYSKRACFPLQEVAAASKEVAEGDVLDLQSGKAPCRICRDDITLAQLRNKRAD